MQYKNVVDKLHCNECPTCQSRESNFYLEVLNRLFLFEKKMYQAVEMAKVFKHAILLRFGKGLESSDLSTSDILTSGLLTSSILTSGLPD